MGRLDEAAKHKVVELRKAGLSFRKIKSVLELDNIKVSAQAIYLFLREFQGRPPGRVCPVDSSVSKMQAQSISAPEKWTAIHLQNLIRNSSQQSQQCGFNAKSTNPNSIKPAGSCSMSSSTSNSQGQGHMDENDIKIVSVSSLAQNTQTVSQAPATRATTNLASTSGAITTALMKRRISPSPATSSMLAARKRILDKALSHRIKSFQQMASLLRRDHTSVQGDPLRRVGQQQQPNACTSNERTHVESHSKGLEGTSSLHFSVQRPSLSVRSPHPPPRVGIRLPSQSVACSVPGTSNLRLPVASCSQTTGHNEGNSSPQQTFQESRVGVPLQDQIQTLSSEVRVLGMAVKMLVEQQCRLEREQVQQTNIQKQILSTLQSMSSKIGCCGTAQQQKTPSPSTSKSTSFNQDSFTCSQGTYTQCSQTQPSFSTMDVLETTEPFKLPEFSPTSMNGFVACSSAESLPLITSPLYQEQNNQTHMSGFTQNYAPAYNQSNNQTFTEKLSNFSNSCAVRTFQDCNISNSAVLSLSSSLQDQVNNIKVEDP